MATQNYTVLLPDGSSVTIANVATLQKDGSGLRLLGEDGTVIASWDDGQSKGCWPAASTVTAAPDPAETPAAS